MIEAKDAVARAKAKGTVIPAFNVPYLPMMKPIIQAVVDNNSVAMIQVARVEWEKFGAQSPEAIAEEYHRLADPKHTLLHLDHIPVVDEDLVEVDYMPLIRRGIDAGYQSVMIDASRLNLDENIEATTQAAQAAHAAGVPLEAELGAVMGHESGPRIPYEEIFATKKGFTDLEEAKRFAEESGADWLSVAVGNIHGAVAENLRDQRKPAARLDVDHIAELSEATGLPLVLHGGSGIEPDYIRRGIAAGIAKINVGTEIRQAYVEALAGDEKNLEEAQRAVYDKVTDIINNMLQIRDTRDLLYTEE